MLLGDYKEVEKWIQEGRVDCGFLRLPTDPSFDTVLLKNDEIQSRSAAGTSTGRPEKNRYKRTE